MKANVLHIYYGILNIAFANISGSCQIECVKQFAYKRGIKLALFYPISDIQNTQLVMYCYFFNADKIQETSR